MSDAETIEEYNRLVSDVTTKYESISFESVHSEIIDLIPEKPGCVLDIGAGSGRDASWFAKHQWDVTAIDPAAKMLKYAAETHRETGIRWVQDKIPSLEKVFRLGLSYDLIWLSAVWMHIPPEQRYRAFRKMVSLMKPSGWLMISLRHGTFSDGRISYPVSSEEISKLAQQHGLTIKRICKSADRFKRDAVSWEWVCLQLPDDGTDALPLIRHTILRDDKSSTYKPALLRILVRIADSACGIAREVDDDTVAIPLGLVALYWIRMYKPLVERGLLQAPPNIKGTGLGFVKDAFKSLKDFAPADLCIGRTFEGSGAELLRQAMIDARDTIRKMPAYYITYPQSSEQIFKASTCGRVSNPERLKMTPEFLWEFGELKIPRHVWFSMSRYACWIEPALINEWIRLMQGYAASSGQSLSYDDLAQALSWLEPDRDTKIVREISDRMLEKDEPVYCIWSGKRLSRSNYDVDHCFPFSYWPCSDLWNLMPAARTLNQREKRDKLVSTETIQRSADRIIDWWDRAYQNKQNLLLHDRFFTEARSSLPVDMSDGFLANENILDGMLIRRQSLKRDLQIPDWSMKE